MSRELYLCERKEIRFGRSCTAIADTDDIFVDLELIEEDTLSGRDRNVDEPPRGRKLQSYQELLTLVDKQNKQSFHVLLIGNAGSGKTTMISRIAYQWALGVGEDGSHVPEALVPPEMLVPVLSAIELVVVLDVRNFRSDQTLAEAIKRQLLPGVSAEEIEKVLTSLGKKCLVLLDGYDEMPHGLKNHALDSPQLPRLFVIITTRPHMTDRFFRKKRGYCRVQLLGFSRESSCKYIDKYFNNIGKQHLADSLKQAVSDTPILSVLSSFPILLVMMCLLWEVAQKKSISFQSMTRLYKEAVKYINRPFEDREEEGEMTRYSLDHILLTLGETALKELLDNTVQIDRDEFIDEDVLKQSVAMGLVLESEGKLVDDTSVMFIHKTFQEYCGAVYLCSLMKGNREKFEHLLSKIQKANVNEMEYLLQFCCGLSKNVAEAVLPHVVNLQGDTKKNVWKLPLVLVYETELSPEGKSLNTKTLHNTLDLNACTELEVGDAVLAAAMSHFTAKNHTLARETWLSKIKSLKSSHSFEKVNSVIEIVGGISSLKKVQLGIHKLLELQGELDGMSSTQNISVEEIHLEGEHREEVEVCIGALLKFLRCMPSLAKVHLEQVNFLADDDDSTASLNTSLKEFEMSSFGNEDVNVNMLVRCLRYMPSLAEVSLRYINLLGIVEQSFPPLSDSLKKFTLSSKEHSVNGATVLGILKCMPLLEHVQLEGVLLTDEVDTALWTQSDSVKNLYINARKSKKSSMTARTILNFVGCFPSLTLFVLGFFDMTGSLDDKTLSQNKCLEHFVMSSSVDVQCTLSVSLLTRFLKHLSAVAKVSLLNIILTSRVEDQSCISSTSVHELRLDGSNDEYILTDSSVLSLLQCLPSLNIATFCHVYMTQSLNAQNDILALNLPLEEFNFFQGVMSCQFLSAVLPTCLKILRIGFLTSQLTKEEIEKVFTADKLQSVEVLDLDRTISNGFSGGIDILLKSCLANVHSMNLTNFLACEAECQQLVEMINKQGKQANSQIIPLQNLFLANSEIGDGLVDLIQAFQYTPYLKYLSLKKCGVQEKHSKELEQHLPCLANLTKIDVSENDIKAVLPFLAPSFPNLSNITVVKLADTNMTDELVTKVPLSKLPKLTELDLAKNRITYKGAETLAESFNSDHTPALQCLYLNDNSIGAEGASALALSFKHLPDLRSLHFLGDESIGMVGLQDILMNLVHLPNLQMLGFNATMESDEIKSSRTSLALKCFKVLGINKSTSEVLTPDQVKSVHKVVREFLTSQ